MTGIAEFVLRHRRWVLISWLLVVIVGIALVNKTNSRLVIDFSLPGQPGTETANQIDQEFHAGGKTAPYVVTLTLPAGQTVSGNEQAIGQAFATVQQKVPDTRVVDEANTGDKAFRTTDGRTAYAILFYRFLHNPTAKLPTDDTPAPLRPPPPPGQPTGLPGRAPLPLATAAAATGCSPRS